MSKSKILIVDDEPRNQRIIIETLDENYDFKTAASGEEALQTLESFDPCLILLDIMMPGIDGYEVCRRIKANSKFGFTKVILISGKAMIEERLEGYAAGADDYMTKPFVAEELLAKTKVFVRLATIEKQLSEQNLSLGQTVEEKTNQLVRTEAKLVTAAKMCALGEMAGGIAHEINTPLGTIALLAEQLVELSREVPMNAELVSKMAASIGPTVERINQITLGLRTFSREGSKDDFESTSLAGIVASTLALCQEKVKSSRVDLRIEPIADHIVIRCRAVQISQVLLNLISNSCHAIAAAPEKWIQISVRASRDFTEIMVADSGSGIAPEVQEKMFQPFYTTKEIGEGTGLGLSISKGIAEIHGGSLILDQTSPHTCLVLRLPSAA